MDSEVVIKVDSVSKTFRLPHEKHGSIKSAVVNFYRHNKGYEIQQALKDITFEINKGEFFGIVGRNGSGKSTMLKMLAGIYSPTLGTIDIKGKLTPFIELGVGFNMELTGRENVFLNGALLGFNRSEMKAMYNDIVEFAEIERFMDQKLKNYSSGMQVRLAFSIAIRSNSDILLLDEVLAVGDAIFQQKCFDYFKELKKDKKTVVFVSHDSGALLQYCDRGLLIEEGKTVYEGPIQKVVNQYQDILADKEENTELKPTENEANRSGSGRMKVIASEVLGQSGDKQQIFRDIDSTIQIKVKYKANENIDEPVYGITINDPSGQQLFASNTLWSQIRSKDLITGAEVEILWSIPNVFNTGTYFINPAVSNSTGTEMFDWRDGYAKFKVRKQLNSTAQINTPHDIKVISVAGNSSS